MTITVSQHTPGQLRQTIQIHSHQINADLTEAAGGTDTGPDPHDLFDAAVATCKAMTLQLFAKRKNIPLQEVKVEISRDDSAEGKGLYQLHVSLELIGDLTAEQREQLLAIADKCPIHKLMTQTEVQVHTSLKAEPVSAENSEPLIIQPQARDIGFMIKRLLPAKAQRRVGPFIFVDHMGPATFAAGNTEGDVRQHPHIGLATVTYLFSGAMLHSDTLGTHQLIEPGAINLMRAGSGIAHSERIPADIREGQVQVEGMQIWLVLPEDEAESEPSFQHYPAALFPAFQVPGSEIRVLLGEYFSQTSVVSFPSRCCYAELKLDPCASLALPKSEQQLAIYLAKGSLKQPVLTAGQMLVMTDDLTVVAGDDGAHLMVLGGDEVPDPVLLSWNFVARNPERLVQAKADWNSGNFPRLTDDPEWIPAP
ncbi:MULTISPECIES: pirin family protein [Rheinheimera]|uniref:pirin family protein n=1 Tax=Rheinheimera TaxID=67575 RepID=UPI001E31D92E|nr:MULTISPECIES: pirin family protein [Rheinheimera]HJS15490.1 pirin family protein [Rheinheimera sp.]